MNTNLHEYYSVACLWWIILNKQQKQQPTHVLIKFYFLSWPVVKRGHGIFKRVVGSEPRDYLCIDAESINSCRKSLAHSKTLITTNWTGIYSLNFGSLHHWSLGMDEYLHPTSLRWRHNGRDSVSNHQPHDCLLNRLFRRRSEKTSKLCVTGLCAGNSPGTGEFPAQMASYAENVSIWWRHHVLWWM